MERRFVYLHGFASSPQSFKAQSLARWFEEGGITLEIPDLNQGDFYTLTLTRQIKQIVELLGDRPSLTTLIGSSFGGLTAAWVAESCPAIDHLVLLAPAFQFAQHWFPKLGEATLQSWRETGEMAVYHYSEQRQLPLHYDFIQDLSHYDEAHLQRSVPTLILHGIHDEVIPVQSSQVFAASRPWVTLVELDSDHGMGHAVEEIWGAIATLCNLTLGNR